MEGVLMYKERIYRTTLSYQQWTFHIAATENGLCYVSLPNEPLQRLYDWTNKWFKNAALVSSDDKLKNYTVQLTNYFKRESIHFSIPLELKGTSFQKTVWKVLQHIPYGETTTYSQIARKIRNEKAVRAVGTSIGANPMPIVIPCHRVIGKNGSLTGYRGGLEMKKFLLRLESDASIRKLNC